MLRLGNQPRPANFLFFLDKQLSLKIKVTQRGFRHCTGDPSNFCVLFMNGPQTPLGQAGS